MMADTGDRILDSRTDMLNVSGRILNSCFLICFSIFDLIARVELQKFGNMENGKRSCK